MWNRSCLNWRHPFSMGLGEASIGRQREQGDTTVLLAHPIEPIAMQMHRPIIQRDVNPFRLRRVLLDHQEEVRHLPHRKARAFAAAACPSLHIQAAGNTPFRPLAGGLHGCGSGSAAASIGHACRRLPPKGVVVFVEEDEALGQPQREHACLCNRLQLLLVERRGRGDVQASALLTDAQAPEQ